MSDYLWDKTGEVDAEAERLEELLGTLRFQPRTFEVPATLPVVRRAPRAVSHFSWARLAVAASLVLVALAGAWLVMIRQRANVALQIATTQPAKENATAQPTQHTANATVNNSTGVPTIKGYSWNTTPTANQPFSGAITGAAFPSGSINTSYRAHRNKSLAVVKRPAMLPRHSIEREVNAPREEIANAKLTPQEREAMEKFMLAMKVTSEKLNYAERQVAELNTKSPQR
jgi:hypothetical protein